MKKNNMKGLKFKAVQTLNNGKKILTDAFTLSDIRVSISEIYGNELYVWGKYGQNVEIDIHTELVRFIGLPDKNEKEIYEGDIVKWGREGSPICKVVFDAPAFKLEEITQEADQFDRYDHRDIEIIGNIYETPELNPRYVELKNDRGDDSGVKELDKNERL